MASSNTEICNMALSHIGIGNEINNLTSEKSAEAGACRRFYEIARKQVLSDFSWPFATKFLSLALIEEDPTTEWAFSYRYPSDCLDFRRILSGTRNDTKQSRIPFRLGNDDSGTLIYTDMQDAIAEYTVDISEVSRFASDFTLALSFLLAALITPRMTGSDRFKISQQMYQLYQAQLSMAKANAMSEEQADELPQSEFIRARTDGVDTIDDILSRLNPA